MSNGYDEMSCDKTIELLEQRGEQREEESIGKMGRVNPAGLVIEKEEVREEILGEFTPDPLCRSAKLKSKTCKENSKPKIAHGIWNKSKNHTLRNKEIIQKNIINEYCLFDPNFTKLFSRSTSNRGRVEEDIVIYKNFEGKLSLMNLRKLLDGEKKKINNSHLKNEEKENSKQTNYKQNEKEYLNYNTIQAKKENDISCLPTKRIKQNYTLQTKSAYKHHNTIKASTLCENTSKYGSVNFNSSSKKSKMISENPTLFYNIHSLGRWTESPINDRVDRENNNFPNNHNLHMLDNQDDEEINRQEYDCRSSLRKDPLNNVAIFHPAEESKKKKKRGLSIFCFCK